MNVKSIALIMILAFTGSAFAAARHSRAVTQFSPPIEGFNYEAMQSAALEYFQTQYGIDPSTVVLKPSRFYPQDPLGVPVAAMGVVTPNLNSKYYPEHTEWYGGRQGGTPMKKSAFGGCVSKNP